MRNLIRLVLGLSLVATLVIALPAHMASASCSGVQVPNTADLAIVADQYGPGTTFCLQAGYFEVSRAVYFTYGDRFIGVGGIKNPSWTPFNGATFWQTPPQTHIYSPSGLTPFRRVTGGSGSTVFQAVHIYGAVDKVGTQNGCTGECGNGVQGAWGNTQFIRVRVSNNEGLGAGPFSGLIQDSEFDHNGGQHAYGRNGNFKSVVGNATVRGSFLHDSVVGAWCDGCGSHVGDGPFVVAGNLILHNWRLGISWEISNTSMAAYGNRIQNNNWSLNAYAAGISVLSSQDADIYNNTMGGNNLAGVRFRKDSRGFALSNDKFRNNRLNGDVMVGCGLAGVTCSNNQ